MVFGSIGVGIRGPGSGVRGGVGIRDSRLPNDILQGLLRIASLRKGGGVVFNQITSGSLVHSVCTSYEFSFGARTRSMDIKTQKDSVRQKIYK